MALLSSGLIIWCLTHFSIRLFPHARQSLIDRIGRWPYMGVFSLVMIGAIVLMVKGWQAIGPDQPLYVFTWARPLSYGLMAAAACLFIAANAPTDIKQLLRHPQLLSVVLWSLAHLLNNGDTRSFMLFGGLGVWAIAEMLLINRAEGPWQKPVPFGLLKTLISIAIGLAVFVGAFYAHPWLSGVALL